MHPWFEASRPAQWVKNLALFVAPLFGRELARAVTSGGLVWAFIAFCAWSSAGYVVNDVRDAAADRAHPLKRERPFARGALSPRGAWRLSLAWVFVGAIAAALSGSHHAALPWFAVAYVVGSTLYSLVLKRLFVVDVLALAGLFLIRIYAGAYAADVPVSPWLASCSLVGACLVGFGKRLAEIDRNLNMFEPSAVGLTRATLQSYRQSWLKNTVLALAVLLFVLYAMYAFAPSTSAQFGSGRMPWTLVFAAAGLARFVGLALMRSERLEDPARLLLTDLPLLVCALGWGIVATCGVVPH